MRLPHTLTAALALVLFATACHSEIQHGLTESEANDIIVLLQSHGIDARKEKEAGTQTGEGSWVVTAAKGDAPRAWELLSEAELPKARVQGLEIFNTGALIPTPTQEKAMLLEALSGELAKTLRDVDGVVDARVHVVLPEEDRFRDRGQPAPEATAAVYVKWRPTATTKTAPFRDEEIQQLVSHGVPNLKPQNVSVMSTMALPVAGAEGGADDGMTSVMGMRMSSDAKTLFMILTGLLVLMAGFLVYTLATRGGATD